MAPSPFLSLDNVSVGVKSTEFSPRSITYVSVQYNRHFADAPGAGTLLVPEVVVFCIFSTVLDFCVVR